VPKTRKSIDDLTQEWWLERSTLDPATGCWLWNGAKRRDGSGCLWFDGGNRHAYLVSWVARNGPIPDGLFVVRKCSAGACVNPDHLVTQASRPVIRRFTKVSADTVQNIRCMSEAGYGVSEIVRVTGASRSNVYMILSRKSWKDVP